VPRSIGSITGLVAKPEYKKALLVEIVMVATTFRYTDYGFPITQTIDSVSRTFAPADVAASGIGEDLDRGSADATLTIWNVDLAWSGVILGTAGARGANVTVWEGWFDGPSSSATWVDYVQLFNGRISESDLTEDVATLKMLPYTTPWSVNIPGQRFVATCGLRFKGPQCQYSGSNTTCDRTYLACQANSNVAHFRGFRFLPDPTKPIVINQISVTLSGG
jgi:hypothetical protein